MKEKNISRLELALKTEISPRTIELIEQGKTESPQLDTVQKIAKALDTTIDDLVSQKGEKNEKRLNGLL